MPDHPTPSGSLRTGDSKDWFSTKFRKESCWPCQGKGKDLSGKRCKHCEGDGWIYARK